MSAESVTLRSAHMRHFPYEPSRYAAEAHRSNGDLPKRAEVEELMRSELYAAMVAIANYNTAGARGYLKLSVIETTLRNSSSIGHFSSGFYPCPDGRFSPAQAKAGFWLSLLTAT